MISAGAMCQVTCIIHKSKNINTLSVAIWGQCKVLNIRIHMEHTKMPVTALPPHRDALQYK